MLAIVRVRMQDGSDALWNFVLDNLNELQNRFAGKAKLMYMTKRMRHEDTSLFIKIENPDILGDFIANKIAKIHGVESLSMVHLMGMRFFRIPKRFLTELTRYVITIRTNPPKVSDIYEKLSKMKSTPEFMPVYIAYTFHLFGDCMMFSGVAPDEAGVKHFVKENIETLPGVLGTTMSIIKKQQRLISESVWEDYVRARLLPD